MCALPGFVDGHTHPVWSGDRVHEFAMKLAGASYVEIHKKGVVFEREVDVRWGDWFYCFAYAGE